MADPLTIDTPFDPLVVDEAIDILRRAEKSKNLGPPSTVLLSNEHPFGLVGVGVEWPGEIRNAVAFKGNDAVANCAETKRRIEEWISTGRGACNG